MDDDDQKRLSSLFDQNVVYQVSRRKLTEDRILAAPTFETVKTNVSLEREFTPEDYKYLERFGELGPRVLERLAKNAPRNRLIVEQYLKKPKVYGPTIVFAADTLHAQTLAEEFQKAPGQRPARGWSGGHRWRISRQRASGRDLPPTRAGRR